MVEGAIFGCLLALGTRVADSSRICVLLIVTSVVQLRRMLAHGAIVHQTLVSVSTHGHTQYHRPITFDYACLVSFASGDHSNEAAPEAIP